MEISDLVLIRTSVRQIDFKTLHLARSFVGVMVSIYHSKKKAYTLTTLLLFFPKMVHKLSAFRAVLLYRLIYSRGPSEYHTGRSFASHRSWRIASTNHNIFGTTELWMVHVTSIRTGLEFTAERWNTYPLNLFNCLAKATNRSPVSLWTQPIPVVSFLNLELKG